MHLYLKLFTQGEKLRQSPEGNDRVNGLEAVGDSWDSRHSLTLWQITSISVQIDSEFCQFKQHFDLNHIFPIDLAQNPISFAAKCIRNV